MFYKDKVCLVTGGTGFIGTHIVQQLLDLGAKVRVPLHNRKMAFKDDRVETFNADLSLLDDCLDAVDGVDYVFNSAGYVASAGASSNRIMNAITADLVLNAQMLQAAWQQGVKRFLLFSSSTVYPESDHPISEGEAWSKPPHNSYFGYGWMRRYLEKMGEFVSKESKMQIALVRPTAVYGQNDNFDLDTCHVVPALIRKAVERQSPYVVWGSGNEVRDFLHVDDLARGCILALEKYAVCDPINIGYGKAVTTREIARMILEISDYEDAIVEFDESKPIAIPCRVVDTLKAERFLGFTPKISLEEGLIRTVRWYECMIRK